jgi:hypothetical protein
MCHPLYPVARRLVGRPVNAHHVSGRIYSGHLQSVTMSGIYMLPYGATVVNMTDSNSEIKHVIQRYDAGENVELVYSPLVYFGFGALTGLTLGALASPFYW